jgi:uncharacterized protein DUF4129
VKAGAVRIATRAGADVRARFSVQSAAGLAAALGSGVAAALAQSKPDFAEAAKGIVRSLDLQTEFPNPAVALAADPFRFDISFARILLWVAVAIGVVVIALYLRDVLPGGLARRRRWDADGGELGEAGGGAEMQAQIDADELARVGRFVEAMHVLLLQALADMRRRLDVAIADSLTSREILRRAQVPPIAKSALQEIVGAVERAYFGDHPADETDYLSCRTNFATFVSALRNGAPA